MAADQNRRPSDRHDCANDHIRVSARARLVGGHLGGVVLRLHHTHLHQARGFEVRLQAMKRRHRHVLRGGNHAAQEVHVAIQMAVIDGVDELPAQDAVDVLEVDDHAGLGVERAAHGDLDHIVVPVVGDARPEHLAVLLIVPVVATQDVRGRECGAAGDRHMRGHGSIRKLAPVRGADSVEASQTITGATSAGERAGPSTPATRSMAVSTEPGLIALTRIPNSRPSTASASVRPARPDLAATYAAMPRNFSAPAIPDRLDTMTIAPPPRRIRRKASRLHRNAPRKPAPSCSSQSRMLVSTKGCLIKTAAQWTSASSDRSWPNALTTWSSSETSQPSLRLSDVTSHRRARSSLTTSPPMPPDPPVTTAVRVIARPPATRIRIGPARRRDSSGGVRLPGPTPGRASGSARSRRRGLRRRRARRETHSRLPLPPPATRRGDTPRPGIRSS